MTQTSATPKQLSFLATMAKDREVNADEATILATVTDPSLCTLSKVSASALIGTLLQRPKVVAVNAGGVVEPKAELAPGYYVKGESYYEVVISKAGRAYAKILTQRPSGSWGWDYAKGAVSTITADDKLTAEQASEFGWMHGTCMRCCADLTVPESVERGYGPVCAAKMGF
jgi:Family of unknown function (DUF6011)